MRAKYFAIVGEREEAYLQEEANAVHCVFVHSVSAHSRCLTSPCQLLSTDVLTSVSPHQLCLSALEGAYQGEGPKHNL